MCGGDRAAALERDASASEAVPEEVEDVESGCAEPVAARDHERESASAGSSRLEEEARKDVSRRLVEAVVASEMGVAADSSLEDASEIERAESGLLREKDEGGAPVSDDMLAFHKGHFKEQSSRRAAPQDGDAVPATARRSIFAAYEPDLADADDDDEQGPLCDGAAESSMLHFHTEHFDEVDKQVRTDGKPVEQEDDADVDQLRSRLKGRLFEALDDGSLNKALESSGMGRRPSQQSEPRPVSEPASPPPLAPALAPAPAALKAAHAAVAATPLVLQAVSQRDRRIGELIAEIASVQRRIAERNDSLNEMERQLGAVKLDAAHFDLDIEWHKRALLGAEERGAELEAKGPTLLKIKPGPEINASALSARSDLSTATGASTQTRSWTPQTPRKALAPLAASPPAPLS